MKAYKVTVNFTSFFSHSFTIGYKIGHKTVPKIGKIFVFKELTDALNFIHLHKYYLSDFDRKHINILFGEAEDVVRITKIPSCRIDFTRFWMLKKLHKSIDALYWNRPPKGTFVCTAFTPEEIVPF